MISTLLSRYFTTVRFYLFSIVVKISINKTDNQTHESAPNHLKGRAEKGWRDNTAWRKNIQVTGMSICDANMILQIQQISSQKSNFILIGY